MIPAAFECAAPKSVAEAVSLLQAAGGIGDPPVRTRGTVGGAVFVNRARASSEWSPQSRPDESLA
jgi:CO/xanthine dehydrogenase FAD-binding subunit